MENRIQSNSPRGVGLAAVEGAIVCGVLAD